MDTHKNFLLEYFYLNAFFAWIYLYIVFQQILLFSKVCLNQELYLLFWEFQ